MTISYGFRPRSDRERIRMGELFRTAPQTVGLAFDDDGWTAACLRISGREPVWCGPGDPWPCNAVLARLGLPPLGTSPVDAVLDASLTLAAVLPALDHEPPPRVRPTRPDGPLVTILVCTYNRAQLLPSALASALAQTWPCEVLVIDDGSTDDTSKVLARTPAVRAVRLPRNAGKPAALARGLAEARGAAILVLDDDDLLLPAAVQVLATALFADPELVAVWGDTVVFEDGTGRVTQVRPASRLPASLTRRAVLQQVPAMPGATLVRTEAWKAAGPLDPTLIRGQDMDLFLALARMGPIETVPLPVFRYRTHNGLRGSAAGQWRKQDRAVHDARFRACVAPVFARRFAEASPVRDRAEAHAWALGLWQRGLPDEARAELDRWPAPYAPAEAWARRTIGLAALEVVGDTTLVVVDEGDEGALEATLAVRARDHALFVDLHVPRDPLGSTQLYWPGTYVARGRLSDVVRRPGPWHLALTSAPGWVPPPLDDTDLLPSALPSPEAVLCTAAVLGWTPPHRVRVGLPTIHGVHSRLAWQARAALDNGQPARAMEPLSELLARLPGWRGAWRMSAEAFGALGHGDEARACRAKAQLAG